MCLSGEGRTLQAVMFVIFGTFATGCVDSRQDTSQPSEPPRAEFSAKDQEAVQDFVDKVMTLGNDNEIIIYFKNADAPPADPGPRADRSANSTAIFRSDPGAGRTALGFAPAGPAARAAVVQLLADFGLRPYSVGRALPFAAVRVPSAKLEDLASALVEHPNVDYVAANLTREVRGMSAPPLGSNPIDNKHTFHRIDDAWDFTRGDGIEIGIIDSGFTSDGGSGWHPDGGNILVRGTVDDYNNCGGYDPSVGTCEKRDDFYEVHETGAIGEAHGTRVVGLVGETDNDMDRVGVAPLADVYSLKAIQNCENTGCNGQNALENDDWQAAIDFAVYEGLDVLSMSFVDVQGNGGVEDALYDAYYTYDILLVAGTGNEVPDHCDGWLVKKPYVMGIGGVTDSGANYGCDGEEEVSALASGEAGYSTDATCSSSGFCTDDGVDQVRGTSAATAITAGIAGLLRAHFPSWSASQIRNRLKGKADGSHNIVNAYRAIVGDDPNVTITGPDAPAENTNQTWYAGVFEGMEPFAYEWYRDDVLVSTNSSYTGNTGSSWFELRVEIVDNIARTDADTMIVVPCSGSQCVQ